MTSTFYYNPDWLSDDELRTGFVARTSLFDRLCEDLRRVPARGTVQHHLLVGVRGAGKTTMLRRLALAMREEEGLQHLVPLMYPEELYELKHLADFWMASCRALADALDADGKDDEVDALDEQMEALEAEQTEINPRVDEALKLFKTACAQLGKRPVLLVDNLDMVFKSIGRVGRKYEPSSPVYWTLREVLSTADAPVIIGGTTRLSEPMSGYDSAFFNYFISHRLGKLSLEEMEAVFDHLALERGGEELQQRIQSQRGRARTLYELTGGNPRTLNLVFDLLRQSSSSRAVDDFKRLLDQTTPYFKARIEELSEQARNVFHALALEKRDFQHRSFGHPASVLARRTNLDTRKVSAQLEIMVEDGVVEKSKSEKGPVQYRVAEQLFRLWLQMRSTRRIRNQVEALAEFLEALFDQDEVREMLRTELASVCKGSRRSQAAMLLAAGDLLFRQDDRHYAQACAASAVLQEAHLGGTSYAESFAPGDLDPEVDQLHRWREQLQDKQRSWSRQGHPETLMVGLLGAVTLSLDEKQELVDMLLDEATEEEGLQQVQATLEEERVELGKAGSSEEEIELIHELRAEGKLSLHCLQPDSLQLEDERINPLLIWKLLGQNRIPVASEEQAAAWVQWGKLHCSEAPCSVHVSAALVMRHMTWYIQAGEVLDMALSHGESAEVWFEKGVLAWKQGDRAEKVEKLYAKALELNPDYGDAWFEFGWLLQRNAPTRLDEVEEAYRRAIAVDKTERRAWIGLIQLLLNDGSRLEEAKTVSRQATCIFSDDSFMWLLLGYVLSEDLTCVDDAEAAFRQACECNPTDAFTLAHFGGFLFVRLFRISEAEAILRQAVEEDPSYILTWQLLGRLFVVMRRYTEAEEAAKQVLKLDPADPNAEDLLTRCKHHQFLAPCEEALISGDWTTFTEQLSKLRANRPDFAELVAGNTFVLSIVRPALNEGNGPRLLEIFQELRMERVAAPLLYALDAAIVGDEAKLQGIEPEAQAAALEIFSSITLFSGQKKSNTQT